MPRTKTIRGQPKNISCPRCGKKFRSETNVLQHMNQPQGHCYGSTLFENFLNPIEGAEAESAFSHPHDIDQNPRHSEGSSNEPTFRQSPMFDNHDVQMDDVAPDSLADPEELAPEQVQPGRYVEVFEGCGQTYPGGKTFMANFWEDTYAEERSTNLYYPWASKQEWEFASWLLRSGLSMAAIDRLMSLDIVSNLTSAVCLTC